MSHLRQKTLTLACILAIAATSAVAGGQWPQFHGPFWVALAFTFALAPFLLRRSRVTDWLLAAMVGSVVVALLGSRGHGLHGFGPRYLFETFAPLYLLTARGFVELTRQSFGGLEVERRLRIAASTTLFVVLCGTAAVSLPHRLGLYRSYNGVDGSLEREVTETRLDRALVLLPTGDWQGWASAARIFDPDPEADLLFIQADPDDAAVVEAAGDRPIYVWRDGRLLPVRPPADPGKIEALGAGAHAPRNFAKENQKPRGGDRQVLAYPMERPAS